MWSILYILKWSKLYIFKLTFIQGYYTRKVKCRRHSVTLRILCVKCMNCKSTHALLLYFYCSLLSLYAKPSSNISRTPIIVVLFCIQKHLSLQSSHNIKKVILHRISCQLYEWILCHLISCYVLINVEAFKCLYILS